jgi:prolyl oligopeptidase
MIYPRIAFLAAALIAAAGPARGQATAPPQYPPTPRGEVVDTYWGTAVPDPYRWLENIDSSQTKAWVQAENTLTHGYLDAVPQRPAVLARWRALIAALPAPPSNWTRHGPWEVIARRPAGGRQVYSVRQGPTGTERVLLDESVLPATDRIEYVVWSPSSRFMAYATTTSGADWLTWRVRDVATGADLSDVVRWGRYVDVAFNGDRGFYYSGYDAPPDGAIMGPAPGPYKAFYHRLGTPQAQDLLVAAAGKPTEFPATMVTEDGAYALEVTGAPDTNGFDVFAPDQPGSPRRILVEPGDGGLRYLANRGPRFWFRTNAGSPNGRVVSVDADDPAHVLRTVVAERPDTLTDAALFGDRIFLNYLHDVHSVIESVNLQGADRRGFALPGIGTATVPHAESDPAHPTYEYESFTQPRTVYRLDVRSGRSTELSRRSVPFDAAPYVTEQLFATSKDGTRVPVFVTRRRDAPFDGSTPTQLYGYGGGGDLFGVTPVFGAPVVLWLELGGAYAVVNARGGGEYGESWHRAGMLANKQHTFDDVIAAAELLTKRKLTSPPKLALVGASEGGLMVGAVITQRPDLFGAALDAVGLEDMLRYQRFNSAESGADEHGTSDQSEAAFHTLLAYSPLHNVREGTRYPAIFILTGDHDDRVFPAHSYKFAAALQHAQAGAAPILLRVGLDQGHYGARTADGIANVLADRYAFLIKALDMHPSLPEAPRTP